MDSHSILSVSDHSTHYSTTNTNYKKVSEITKRLLQPHSITTAHKSAKVFQHILSKPKDPVGPEKKNELSAMYSVVVKFTR